MRIGLIGTGNMGSALMRGYLAANKNKNEEIFAFDKDKEKSAEFCIALGIHSCQSAEEVAEKSELVVLAVKPDILSDVLTEIAPAIKRKSPVIVSIASGISISWMEKQVSGACKIVRAMPNTPALVGKGMSAIARNSEVTDQEFQAVHELFSSVGRVEEVEESLMDCVTGVSGSGPAYVYLFIEALADGAVAQGMTREKAYTFAAQTVLGGAEMVLSTGRHPGELKDMVCSPGGTTIEAVNSLEKNGFRNAVQEAVAAAAEKSRRMTK